MRAALAILAGTVFAVLPGASHAQSATTRYDLPGGHVIDLPASVQVSLDIAVSDPPGEERLWLMSVDPGTRDEPPAFLVVDEAPGLDGNFAALSALEGRDLLDQIVVSVGMDPDDIDDVQETLTYSTDRSEGLLRVHISYQEPEAMAENRTTGTILVVIRPSGSFWALGVHTPGSPSSESLLLAIASVRPTP